MDEVYQDKQAQPRKVEHEKQHLRAVKRQEELGSKSDKYKPWMNNQIPASEDRKINN